jgi:formate dehydrogenase iron-sulfur subunit
MNGNWKAPGLQSCFSSVKLSMSLSGNSDEPQTLIDQLLAEQSSLTAVAKFARAEVRHENPAQSRYYRDLVPLDRPQSGQQYAFEVDLDKCSGCKACVTACHSLNGLDDEETWRNVGLLHGGTYLEPLQQTVTTACHHCVDPACANGCPVLAYEKDPVTGIVKHLDDQCIGCQYCILKCPYDVPKYSARLGIVRKCDLCSSRLASGEAPACVQACPSEAIRITLVKQGEIAAIYREEVGASNRFLPGSPAPAYTLPTTRYKSARPWPETLGSADAQELKPQPPHTPLAVMLVLSQLSVGAFVVERGLTVVAPAGLTTAVSSALTATALVIGLAALVTSTLHLGRPGGAWRAVLGLRKSWLSREIVVFGLFAKLALLHTGAVWFPEHTSLSFRSALGWATVMTGLIGVFCSVMIYHDTRREFWHLRYSGGKFFGTTGLLGAGTSLLVTACLNPAAPFLPTLGLLMLVAGAGKLAVELPIVRHLEVEDYSPLHKTALLLQGKFGLMHRWRLACGVVGGIFLPALLALQVVATNVVSGVVIAEAAAALTLCLVGELIERRLFFVAVQPVTMPGGVAS